MVLCSPRVLFPAAASAVYLGGDAGTVGMLFASLAVGGLVGSLLHTSPGDSNRSAAAALSRMTIGWGTATIAFGCVVGVSSPHPTAMLVLAVLALGIAGLVDARATVLRQTIVQSRVDPNHLGRIQGLVFVVGVAAPRLGDALMGVVGEAMEVPAAAVAGGASCIVVTVALTAVVRRRMARADEAVSRLAPSGVET